MSQVAAIELNGVGKRFTKYVDAPMLVSSALRFRAKNRREQLWAVRNLNLTVAKGESIGIIGRNGSGKSTTMTMIAGITAPTEGSVKVWGRIAPLISVGVGFHQELTGRENVYVNGAILGLTRREIDEAFDEIVEFSEIGDFIDTPVKFYSSGMYVRLGFAVAAHADPQVLIVDEVLAVGDLAFQLKCFARMEEIRESGATIVSVSHNLEVIRRMCSRVGVMVYGEMKYLGDADGAISLFHEIMASASQVDAVKDGSGFDANVLKLEETELFGEAGASHTFAVGETITLRVRGHALDSVDDLVFALQVGSADGTQLFSETSVNQVFGPIKAGEPFVCSLAFRNRFPSGSFRMRVRIFSRDLRSTYGVTEAVPFYCSGRHGVGGVNDIEPTFTREAVTQTNGSSPTLS